VVRPSASVWLVSRFVAGLNTYEVVSAPEVPAASVTDVGCPLALKL
jgi:hypothetical protein